MVTDAHPSRDKHKFFQEPVTTDLAPDYFNIIRTPMDFSTMRKKLAAGEYKTIDDLQVYQRGNIGF